MDSRRGKAGRGSRRGRSGRYKPRGATFWEIAGVVFGIFVIILGVGYVVGAYYLVGVLGEIAQKDFTPANQRLSSYEDFFVGLQRQGLEVEKSAPYIREGVKYFLWAVTLPDEQRRLIYRWKHDLETNRVSPLTSAATYLDIELGYIRRQEVGLYPYTPGDELALQLAKGTYHPPPPEAEAETSKPTEEAASPEPESNASEGGKAIEVGGGSRRVVPEAGDDGNSRPRGEGLPVH